MQELILAIKDKEMKVIFFNKCVIFLNNLRRSGKVKDKKKWS